MLYTDENGTIEYRLPTLREGLALGKSLPSEIGDTKVFLDLILTNLDFIGSHIVKVEYDDKKSFDELCEDCGYLKVISEIFAEMIGRSMNGVKKSQL